jgi:2-oxoisovalerate dehydrogenase E1 component alpha subunit
MTGSITFKCRCRCHQRKPRYRDREEIEVWTARDPLARMRTLLDSQFWADDRFYTTVEAEAAELAAEARSACLALEAAPLEATFRNTFVTETASLRAEREKYTAHQESFL